MDRKVGKTLQCEVCTDKCNSADVSGVTVELWKERVCELVESYAVEDFWNLDKMGCFWKVRPDRGFAQKGA